MVVAVGPLGSFLKAASGPCPSCIPEDKTRAPPVSWACPESRRALHLTSSSQCRLTQLCLLPDVPAGTLFSSLQSEAGLEAEWGCLPGYYMALPA